MKIEIPELIAPDKLAINSSDEIYGQICIIPIQTLDLDIRHARSLHEMSDDDHDVAMDAVDALENAMIVRLARSYRAAWGLHIGYDTPLKPLLLDVFDRLRESGYADHQALADRLEIFLFENSKDAE